MELGDGSFELLGSEARILRTLEGVFRPFAASGRFTGVLTDGNAGCLTVFFATCKSERLNSADPELDVGRELAK